jgi:hypothetical protein
MSEQENILLRNEIARLNRLLEALLTANEVLRRENAALISAKASPEFGSSVAENSNGITEVGSSVIENSNGIKEFSSSVAESSNGIKEFSSSVIENSNGIKEFASSVAENSNGITENLLPLPERIDTGSFTYYYITQKLKTGAHAKAKYSGLKSHAKMLVHFYNGSGGSHPELKKLTELSDGGLAKSIMSLTKRGLIVRSGFQKFSLTAAGKKIVQEGWNDFTKAKKL